MGNVIAFVFIQKQIHVKIGIFWKREISFGTKTNVNLHVMMKTVQLLGGINIFGYQF